MQVAFHIELPSLITPPPPPPTLTAMIYADGISYRATFLNHPPPPLPPTLTAMIYAGGISYRATFLNHPPPPPLPPTLTAMIYAGGIPHRATFLNCVYVINRCYITYSITCCCHATCCHNYTKTVTMVIYSNTCNCGILTLYCMFGLHKTS